MTISMKVEDNQAQLQMVSGHGHVRAALEAALPQLRSQLADQRYPAHPEQHQPSDASGGSAAVCLSAAPAARISLKETASLPMIALRPPGEESLSAPAALQLRARGDGAVDTFA
ncbi:Flagellar hook-length control protein [Pluralibacter gergoviae]|nr:Flagellar hook-length control protein [Pluralibacter gergoviae]